MAELDGRSLRQLYKSRNNVTDAKNSMGKLLPVCVRHLGYWRKSLEVALDSPQQSRNNKSDAKIGYKNYFRFGAAILGNG